MALGRPPVLKDIVEEHLEELDFLWEQREGVVFAPDWTLEDLAELEARAEAHLDGLRLAELHAVDLALEALASGETGAATAATFVLLETGEGTFATEVVRALGSGDAPTVEGVRIGLRHSAVDALEAALSDLAASADGLVRAAVFDVLAFHRRPLPSGLEALLSDSDAGVRRLAWGAAGRAPGVLGAAQLELALQEAEPGVGRSALEALARAGLPGLREACLSAATDLRGAHPGALAFLGVLGHPADVDPLSRGLENPETASAAVEGLGALGDPSAVPALLAAMEDEALADLAAAAFVRITGFEDVRGERPPPNLEPGSLDEEFEEAEEGPVEVNRVRAWWEVHASEFHPGRLWQAGLDVGGGVTGSEWQALPLLVRRDVYHRCASTRTASDAIELEATVASGRARAD